MMQDRPWLHERHFYPELRDTEGRRSRGREGQVPAEWADTGSLFDKGIDDPYTRNNLVVLQIFRQELLT